MSICYKCYKNLDGYKIDINVCFLMSTRGRNSTEGCPVPQQDPLQERPLAGLAGVAQSTQSGRYLVPRLRYVETKSRMHSLSNLQSSWFSLAYTLHTFIFPNHFAFFRLSSTNFFHLAFFSQVSRFFFTPFSYIFEV